MKTYVLVDHTPDELCLYVNTLGVFTSKRTLLQTVFDDPFYLVVPVSKRNDAISVIIMDGSFDMAAIQVWDGLDILCDNEEPRKDDYLKIKMSKDQAKKMRTLQKAHPKITKEIIKRFHKNQNVYGILQDLELGENKELIELLQFTILKECLPN